MFGLIASGCGMQARKAGKQAGWGFTKAASTWPKPDSSASEALGPLRMVSNGSQMSVQHYRSVHLCEEQMSYSDGCHPHPYDISVPSVQCLV